MAEQMSYIGRCKCGAIVAATVDKPERVESNAEAISEWMLDGLTIERVSVEHVRAHWSDCVCPPLGEGTER